jgi:thymidylate synthase ThyX
VEVTPDGDTLVTAALLHGASCSPWNTCLARARSLGYQEKAGVIRTALGGLQAHDTVPRAFELVGCQFDVVLSAACFGQFKRHRMATLMAQPYDPALGYTMPESVEKVGLVPQFKEVMERSIRLYEQVAARHPQAADYALTQAHRRRILVGMNAREIYHFSRLRQDAHAQWDIRQLADRMVHLCRQELPLTLMLVCGKDRFDEIRAEVYGTA